MTKFDRINFVTWKSMMKVVSHTKSLKQEVWAFVFKDESKNAASNIDQSSFE